MAVRREDEVAVRKEVLTVVVCAFGMAVAAAASMATALAVGIQTGWGIALAALPVLALVGWITARTLGKQPGWGESIPTPTALLMWSATCGTIALICFLNGDPASGWVMLTLSAVVPVWSTVVSMLRRRRG